MQRCHPLGCDLAGITSPGLSHVRRSATCAATGQGMRPAEESERASLSNAVAVALTARPVAFARSNSWRARWAGMRISTRTSSSGRYTRCPTAADLRELGPHERARGWLRALHCLQILRAEGQSPHSVRMASPASSESQFRASKSLPGSPSRADATACVRPATRPKVSLESAPFARVLRRQSSRDLSPSRAISRV